MNEAPSNPEPAEVRCAECGTRLVEGQDRVATDDRLFCRSCYDGLTEQLRQVVESQARDINYSMAVAGAALGAAAGAALWWGFTVATNVRFGLIAVAIGFAAGKGTVLAVGGRRARGLQITAAVVTTAAYWYATYLVNRTYFQRAYAEQGQPDFVLPWLPGPDLFFQVVSAGFRLFDLVFLAIAVYQAWSIPAPLKLAPRG